jgi:TPR repeat protein
VAAACFELAGLYETGQGVPRDVVRANALVKQACDGSEPRACEKLKRQQRR